MPLFLCVSVQIENKEWAWRLIDDLPGSLVIQSATLNPLLATKVRTVSLFLSCDQRPKLAVCDDFGVRVSESVSLLYMYMCFSFLHSKASKDNNEIKRKPPLPSEPKAGTSVGVTTNIRHCQLYFQIRLKCQKRFCSGQWVFLGGTWMPSS